MPNKNNQINEFWGWFQAHEQTLAGLMENSNLMEELDQRVRNLNPEISWEIGPGLSKQSRFVISPNLDRDLAGFTRSVIEKAPRLDGWEFYAARPPKEWDYRFDLQSEENKLISLDATNWHFVLLAYPDGTREILVRGYKLPPLTETERWQACAIALENILGETVLMDKIDEFELLNEFESRFASREQPISNLYKAVTGTSKPN